MKFFVCVLTLVLGLICVGRNVSGQTPSPSPAAATFAFGEVTALDASKQQISLNTKQGPVTAQFDARTKFVRVPPGAQTLEKAEPITLADVAVGDTVMARGRVSEDGRLVQARQIVLMSKTAIVQKQESERQEWLRRGIAGRATAVDPATKEITLLVRGPAGERPVTVAAANASFRRYAPDSIKFSDAKPSAFGELKAGDQVRALGERSADGSRYTAEEVVFGSFRMVGGAITAVDASKREITINDIPTKKPLVVVVDGNSTLRRIPAEMVTALKAKTSAGGGTPASANAARSGEGEIQEVFDRLPAVTVGELKPGDMILVASTAGADPSRVTAILLATGLDPLFNQPQPRQAARPQVGAVGLPSGVFDGLIGTP